MEIVKQANGWDRIRARINAKFDKTEALFKDFIEENLSDFEYIGKDIKKELEIYKKERSKL